VWQQRAATAAAATPAADCPVLDAAKAVWSDGLLVWSVEVLYWPCLLLLWISHQWLPRSLCINQGQTAKNDSAH
jgi:hypothetical protein